MRCIALAIIIGAIMLDGAIRGKKSSEADAASVGIGIFIAGAFLTFLALGI